MMKAKKAFISSSLFHHPHHEQQQQQPTPPPPCSLSPPSSPSSLFLLFMQHPKNSQSSTRKPWYHKAMEMATIWKNLPKSPEIPKSTPWKTVNSKSTEISAMNSSRQKLRKCTSMKVATSFTRVCLCAPISSYTEVFHADVSVPPRRSYSYPRSKALGGAQQEIRVPTTRISTERRIFRGKSLTDDVLMRRFVVEEEAMMQVRRKNQMEIIRKRAVMRRRKLGPSPLSKMSLAEEE